MKKIITLLWILIPGLFLHAQVERAVVVEHFTNTRCGICGSKNPPFYQMLENYPDVIHIAYHPSSPYSNCLFSQHNPGENDARTNFYSIYGGTPRVVVNGNVVSPSTPLLPENVLLDEIGKTTDYSVSIEHSILPDESVRAQITLKQTGGKSAEDLKAYAVLTERLVEYAAPNGENLHHDVFRKVLLDIPVSLSGANDSIVLVDFINRNLYRDPEDSTLNTYPFKAGAEPWVNYFVKGTRSEAIYTAKSIYEAGLVPNMDVRDFRIKFDTESLDGKVVGVRLKTDIYRTAAFGFSFYCLYEDQATEFIKAMMDWFFAED